ncbi:S53 family peptidase [Actinomadura sp. DC4]|uniref:S53 family peptidase n=1 Tax=Actinomadura sp. DC4 TaxID=3055069 RepID=UPI0025AF4389|nr:S53 family peptidase [Actinomadura sp. DC4]MDN3351683.1 S53 family peptidase [Actinomadura sp. DC4]
MNPRRRAAIIFAALISMVLPLAAIPSAGAAVDASKLSVGFGCASARAGQLHCFGRIRAHRASNGKVAPLTVTSPTGLLPADLQSAYNVAGLDGGGRTVAIVDAYDDPKAEADLTHYRSQLGLPACTTANGCFKKVNQSGQTSPLPATDYGWAEEISLDLDMVSAICPSCHILLVEANEPTDAALGAAVDAAAATSGVVAISNSYGGAEDATILTADAHFNHPGIAVTASSGDSGYGVSWPASSQYVTAVGGTTLNRASNARGWTETAWSGAGSGCSAYEPKPSWQHDTACARRTVADVSAVADPATGVGVYDTYNNCGTSAFCDFLISLGLVSGLDGWAAVGGTSASSPIIASVYALAGNTGGITYGSYPYAHTSALFDVTSGSNGSCGGTYLCTAGPGYDGPTGLGTPNGTGGF